MSTPSTMFSLQLMKSSCLRRRRRTAEDHNKEGLQHTSELLHASERATMGRAPHDSEQATIGILMDVADGLYEFPAGHGELRTGHRRAAQGD